MSFRFADSFSHYSINELLGTGNGNKWTGNTSLTSTVVSLVSNGGRLSGNCVQFTTSNTYGLFKTLDNQASWIIGFAFKLTVALPTSTGGMCITSLYDSGSTQCDLRIFPDGTLGVTRNGTLLTGGKSTVPLQLNVWYYIEWKCTISSSISSNTCQVNLNGAQVINVTAAQSTKTTGNATANQIYIGSITSAAGLGTVVYSYCDLYICDSQGSVNNTFLGDIRVDYRTPLAASATNHDWTLNGGSSSVSCVNEQYPNGDTNFISSSTTNQISTFTLPALASTPNNIIGIQVLHNSRKTDAGTRQVADLLRSGSTNYPGTTQNLASSYTYYPTIYETDPNTSAAWNSSGANALEIGVKEIT